MPNNSPASMASEIRAGLARQGLNQDDLAQHLQLSRTAIGNRLNGKVGFKVDELRATAELIRIPAADLISLPDFPEAVAS